MSVAKVKRQVSLVFEPGGPVAGAKKERQFRRSLSALLLLDQGRTLFVGGDETVRKWPSIERLIRQVDGSYAEHESLSLRDFIELPDEDEDKGRVGEIDIEGLDEDGEYLWLTGSHCSTRKQPKSDDSPAEQLDDLASIERGKNRFFVGAIPLDARGGTSKLAREHEGRHAARLSRRWLDVLEKDPHLQPFLPGSKQALPSKDNGFDVEGLSVSRRADQSTRLLLGLRGPVLGGFAIVLELCPVWTEEQELELGPIPGGEALYRKHFLDLQGLGVRDVGFQGDDLLILAGPTMKLDGPVALFRWRAPFSVAATSDSITHLGAGALTREVLLPFLEGKDHAESFAVLEAEAGESTELLVIYDSPHDGRLDEDTSVRADVFPF